MSEVHRTINKKAVVAQAAVAAEKVVLVYSVGLKPEVNAALKPLGDKVHFLALDPRNGKRAEAAGLKPPAPAKVDVGDFLLGINSRWMNRSCRRWASKSCRPATAPRWWNRPMSSCLLLSGQSAPSTSPTSMERSNRGRQQLTEELLNRVEQPIRAHAPCLSCSTHAIGQMPIQIELIGPDGEIVNTLRRD